MIGETLGSYKIVGKIGEGGMGVVYVAEHPLIGRRAAIKLLHPDLSKNEEIVARFFNEARATTLIKHPGIVDIFDFGYHPNGSAYIAMEYLDGESLASRMKRGRLSVAQTATLGRQIAIALGAAHAKGIVHRDLKPDNVYLTPDEGVAGGERVKLLDFGIAKLAQAGEATKTRTGSVMGTPAYMSPEQCRGAGEVDHRADVYSLGCMLYEMVTGRPPFMAEGVGELIGAHLHMQPEPPRSIEPSIPPPFEALILRCLAKNPAQRYNKMVDLARELERWGAATNLTPIPGAAQSNPGVDATLPGNTPVPGSIPGTRVDGVGPTTLGGAAGEQGHTGPRKKSHALIYVGAGVALAAGAVTAILVLGGDKKKDPGPVVDPTPKPVVKAPDAGVAATPLTPEKNPWVRVSPPEEQVLLGVSYDDVPGDVNGFRPSRKITAPAEAYEVQQHEVTWGELDPWLAKNEARVFERPDWVAADPAARADFPATGVPWETASAYCQSLGGDLPTEEQWEYAARGAARRPYPWGGARIDPARTRVYAGPDARPAKVSSSPQDRTPGKGPEQIHDLLGNAQEWTADLWREDLPGQDEAWASEGGLTFRPIRGLPLTAKAPAKLPQEGAAHRTSLCATGECPKGTAAITQFVGFRCARPAK